MGRRELPPLHLPDVFVEKPRGNEPQHVNRCSSIGHPCPYKGFLARTRWKEQRPWSEDFLRIFKLGNEVQDKAIAASLRNGLRVMRSEETLEWPEYQLSGHMDGVVEVGNVIELMERDGKIIDPAMYDENPRDLVAIDFKSADPGMFRKHTTIEHLLAPLTTPSAYRWSYPVQLSLYAAHESVRAKWCCIYWVNRGDFQTAQTWWSINHELAQTEIKRAFKACEEINYGINEWQNANQEDRPELCTKIAMALAHPGVWCEGCTFGHACERYLLTGQDMFVKLELTDLVLEREHLKDATAETNKRYEQIQKRLQAIWRDYHKKNGDCEVLVGEGRSVLVKKTRRGYVRATYR